MIISASRRTDIPSYYGQWMVNALHRGFVLVPNPYNAQRYYRVDLRREAVDCLVFWTKNVAPFLSFLPQINALGHVYYFQYTITPYNRSVERNLPDKIYIIRTFKNLSNVIGPHRVVWRYDPIVLNDTFTLEYHEQAFESMAKMLQGYTQRCIISFVDIYKNMQKRLGMTPQYSTDISIMHSVAEKISTIAKKYNIKIYTCSEEGDFSCFGIEKSACIDKNIIENILGCPIDVRQDKNQRTECRCVESVEIGTYNCCANGCTYCYALSSEVQSARNMAKHDPTSPLLIGVLPLDAIITQRDNRSIVQRQLSLL